MWNVSLPFTGRVRGSSDREGEGARRQLLRTVSFVLIHRVTNSCVRYNSKAVLKSTSGLTFAC
jgi:hypothetical protein